MKRWERKRAKGKPRFVILFSLWFLAWWGSTLVLLSVFVRLQAGLPLSIELTNIDWAGGIGMLIGLPVLVSFLMWSGNEQQYKKALASQPQEEEPTESE